MQFIEMSGKTLLRLVTEDEIAHDDLTKMGISEKSLVRVNRQGDVEVRRHDRWDVIGGLLGEFDARVQKEAGLDWA